MEVQTKQQVTEIVIILTPRDFSSLKALIDLGERWSAICADMIPEEVKVEHAKWCEEQIAKQIAEQGHEASSRTISFRDLKEKAMKDFCRHTLGEKEVNCPQEKDGSVVQAVDKSKYYNAVFQHIKWEHAQQLLTLAKQLDIEFGKIESE